MLAYVVIGFALLTPFGLFAAEMSCREFLLNYSLCPHTPEQLKLTQSQFLSLAVLPDSD